MAFYTAGVEYALHTVLNIERAGPGAAPSSRELAEFQRLPLAYTRRLLTQLQAAGIVHADEGVHGGWRLARPAADITVLDVADAAHGTEGLFECRDVRRHCALWDDDGAPPAARTGMCEIHAVMVRAEQALRRELAATNIADLRDAVAHKLPARATAAVAVWFTERSTERRGASRLGSSNPRKVPGNG